MCSDDIHVIDTSNGLEDGQEKCPKCGATDISLNSHNGMLRCNFCRHEFEPKYVEPDDDISQLKGVTIGLGASTIDNEVSSIITLKCTSCGSEVVVDTQEATQTRCHWCRNMLSINNQVPNGAIPDMVLPFALHKDEAKDLITKFVKERTFFAHPRFKAEFTLDNVLGVYLPYMVVDLNTNAQFSGVGEIQTRTYTVKSSDGKSSKRYYDADEYKVSRSFDMQVDNLTVESNLDRLKHHQSTKTNNILNAILPFDIENCVKWNANYLKGFTSEKRDVNIEELRKLVQLQTQDIARNQINNDLKRYDRGIHWNSENIEFKGEKWLTSYLPIWLYSYQQPTGSKKIHYVAVNARTKETMGSIPIHVPLLLFASFIVEILAFIAMMFIDFEYNWVLLVAGFLYFYYYYRRYRNTDKRHNHEFETNCSINNIERSDQFSRHRTRLSNSKISGQNNTKVKGVNIFK